MDLTRDQQLLARITLPLGAERLAVHVGQQAYTALVTLDGQPALYSGYFSRKRRGTFSRHPDRLTERHRLELAHLPSPLLRRAVIPDDPTPLEQHADALHHLMHPVLDGLHLQPEPGREAHAVSRAIRRILLARRVKATPGVDWWYLDEVITHSGEVRRTRRGTEHHLTRQDGKITVLTEHQLLADALPLVIPPHPRR